MPTQNNVDCLPRKLLKGLRGKSAQMVAAKLVGNGWDRKSQYKWRGAGLIWELGGALEVEVANHFCVIERSLGMTQLPDEIKDDQQR